MQSIISLLLPDWKKVLLFAIFLLIAIAGFIQKAPITETPPAPPGQQMPFDGFAFTYLSIMLTFPYFVPMLIMAFAGILPYTSSEVFFIAGDIIYLYLLSCLTVSGYNRYGRRFSAGLWVAIAGLSLIVLAPIISGFHHRSISMVNILNYLGGFLVIALYFHLLFCLGAGVYERVTRRKVIPT